MLSERRPGGRSHGARPTTAGPARNIATTAGQARDTATTTAGPARHTASGPLPRQIPIWPHFTHVTYCNRFPPAVFLPPPPPEKGQEARGAPVTHACPLHPTPRLFRTPPRRRTRCDPFLRPPPCASRRPSSFEYRPARRDTLQPFLRPPSSALRQPSNPVTERKQTRSCFNSFYHPFLCSTLATTLLERQRSLRA